MSTEQTPRPDWLETTAPPGMEAIAHVEGQQVQAYVIVGLRIPGYGPKILTMPRRFVPNTTAGLKDVMGLVHDDWCALRKEAEAVIATVINVANSRKK